MNRKLLSSSIAAVLLGSGAIVAQSSDLGVVSSGSGSNQAGGAHILGMDDPNRIPGDYIVVLRDDIAGTQNVSAVASDMASLNGFEVQREYSSALRGFSISTFGDHEFATQNLEAMAQDPRVDFIEADRKVYLNEQEQTGATWGLDRVAQQNLPLDGSYFYSAEGSGVDAFIIDTGINTSHQDFEGRVVDGVNTEGGSDINDCNGHGTHVASTTAGAEYGVAKDANLFSVRVFGCQGGTTNQAILDGIDWSVQQANQRGNPAVANLSLGGGASQALDNAVNNAAGQGMTMVVAAGNENQDACNVSPARADDALTVGSTQDNDNRSNFSNFGSCVDIFAPGTDITAAWHTSNAATNTISGTSMAAPHVAGAVALYKEGEPSATPAQAEAALVDKATSGVVGNPGQGSPNELLYTRAIAGGGDDDDDDDDDDDNGGDEPPPDDPEGCPSGYESYTGSLSGSGDDAYEPDGTYYQAGAGTHSGILSSPSDAIFDLFLEEYSFWSGWQVVAQDLPNSGDQDAEVQYQGNSGYFVWRAESWTGSGQYELCIDTP